MRFLVLPDTSEAAREAAIEAASLAVRRGELVVVPTDTVYGLGADAFDPAAVRRLLKAKGRGPDTTRPLAGRPGRGLESGLLMHRCHPSRSKVRARPERSATGLPALRLVTVAALCRNPTGFAKRQVRVCGCAPSIPAGHGAHKPLIRADMDTAGLRLPPPGHGDCFSKSIPCHSQPTISSRRASLVRSSDTNRRG